MVIVGVVLLAFVLKPDLSGQRQSGADPIQTADLFRTSDSCIACHNGLLMPSGEDVSIGFDWRASMMANSARDPYWQAAVRREVIDHPEAQEAIEDECSKCHMPMARYTAKVEGRMGTVFEHLPIGSGSSHEGLLAADGVSCTVCHQIAEEGLGTPESFVGGFKIDTTQPDGERAIYGPFDVEDNRVRLMQSTTGFKQTEAPHIQESELCATCHTLITYVLGPDGTVIGELPEQVPYQEWLHSEYREEKSCQDCHMPEVEESMPIASVLGQTREGLSRHAFRGANVFMMQMLQRYRSELGVEALPQELALAAIRTRQHLENDSARVLLEGAELNGRYLEADVFVESLAGHKLPTAYPSRRAWLEFTVQDGKGNVVFRSGSLTVEGQILGNDNDVDATLYEPHYEEITSADQVQIYESIMVDSAGSLTTGLLQGVRYVKDNRLLPAGFDKATAEAEVAVHGPAMTDTDFLGGSDRVHYSIDLSNAQGPFVAEAVLWYQSIGYRWAENLRPYDAEEPRRFLRYYTSMANASGVVLGRSSATVE